MCTVGCHFNFPFTLHFEDPDANIWRSLVAPEKLQNSRRILIVPERTWYQNVHQILLHPFRPKSSETVETGQSYGFFEKEQYNM
uniref:Exostosin domain-containing protein n=1 Tax=Steinernema glaseri TaxID=37863 RepID=A0A1I8AK39_9BILA